MTSITVDSERAAINSKKKKKKKKKILTSVYGCFFILDSIYGGRFKLQDYKTWYNNQEMH